VQSVVVDLPLDEEKALNIALNKVTGAWEHAKLADLLQELDTGSFDMALTGFAPFELENFATWMPSGAGPADAATTGEPGAVQSLSLSDRFGVPRSLC
jgi:hypothetical protein